MFISNRFGHYFAVDASVDIDPAKLIDCTIHDDLGAMYAAVSKLWGVDVDEVVGAELTVKMIDDNIVVLDSRLCGDAIETTIENEINNWEM